MLLKDILKDWKTLNREIADMSEDKLKALLEAEQAGLNRPSYLDRIHSRYNIERARRERAALLEGTKK